MMRDTNGPLPDTAFWRAYGGTFQGTFSWESFTDLWQNLAVSEGGWYVFEPEGEAPAAPVASADWLVALDLARACVDQVRNRSYCGQAFADSLTDPTFIKVFDPYKMGAACGSSGERVLPRWIFSRIAPDALPLRPETPEKRRFFARRAG